MYIGEAESPRLSLCYYRCAASRTRLHTRSIVNYRPNLYSRLPETARKSVSVCACEAPPSNGLPLPLPLPLPPLTVYHRKMEARNSFLSPPPFVSFARHPTFLSFLLFVSLSYVIFRRPLSPTVVLRDRIRSAAATATAIATRVNIACPNVSAAFARHCRNRVRIAVSFVRSTACSWRRVRNGVYARATRGRRGWNEERTKKGERRMERGGEGGKVGERSGENVYAAESIPTIDRTDIRIPLRENRRDRRVPGSTRRASGHEERTTFTEEAASTLLSLSLPPSHPAYLSLSLSLSLATSPSAPFLLFRFAERVVSRPPTGSRSSRPVGQLRLHVPFDERFRAKTRPTSRDRLPSGFDGFVSPLRQPRLGAAFHGNGEYGSVALTDRHFASLSNSFTFDACNIIDLFLERFDCPIPGSSAVAYRYIRDDRKCESSRNKSLT